MINYKIGNFDNLVKHWIFIVFIADLLLFSSNLAFCKLKQLIIKKLLKRDKKVRFNSIKKTCQCVN